VVVRFGPTIGVFAPDSNPDEPFTAAWLDRLSRWERGDTGTPEELAWEAAALLVAHRATAPIWGTAIRVPDGYLVLLHGAVRAEIDGPGGRLELSGAQDLTWVDRRVLDPITRVALSLAPSGEIVADPRSDLRGGLVPTGSGLVLTTAPVGGSAQVGGLTPVVPGPGLGAVSSSGGPGLGAASSSGGPGLGAVSSSGLGWSPGPRPDPAGQRPDPRRSPGADRPHPAGPPTPAPPPGPARSPVPPPAPWRSPGPSSVPSSVAGAGAGSGPVPVPAGSLPPAGPTTTLRVDPDRLAGQVPPPAGPQVPRVPEETQVVTVSSGMLVADDGTRTILDRAYVLGRDPGNDPAVVGGYATPICVDDPDSLISRVQARVAAAGGVVTVSDANSANGTYIAAPGAREWTRVGTAPTVLPEGWSMRLGRRVFTHTAAETPGH
jgi:hypothetical protein